MVYKKELTYNEIIDILDKSFIGAITSGGTQPPARSEKSDLKLMLETLIPNEKKVNVTNDDSS